jgi:hypothetical protein
VTFGAPVLVPGNGRLEFIFVIIQLVVPVKSNRHAIVAGRGFDRPANEIAFSPGCEFDRPPERLGHNKFELPFGTGYGAVLRRLDSDHGAGEGAFVVTDTAADNPVRTRSLRRNLEPRAKCDSRQNEKAQNRDPFRIP